MNDHLHAAGLLEHLKGDAPTPKKILEAIQTLFAAMNEVQENVTSRFESKTKVAFTTSPGYASMPPALQFVYAILIPIAEGNAWWRLITSFDACIRLGSTIFFCTYYDLSAPSLRISAYSTFFFFIDWHFLTVNLDSFLFFRSFIP